ncbi:hypothetical protein C8J56DRAFT_1173427 [Mycena floridula]|nr:hypothetical protein C8J56DRAFT_1173427 [Mycena floridula]
MVTCFSKPIYLNSNVNITRAVQNSVNALQTSDISNNAVQRLQFFLAKVSSTRPSLLDSLYYLGLEFLKPVTFACLDMPCNLVSSARRQHTYSEVFKVLAFGKKEDPDVDRITPLSIISRRALGSNNLTKTSDYRQIVLVFGIWRKTEKATSLVDATACLNDLMKDFFKEMNHQLRNMPSDHLYFARAWHSDMLLRIMNHMKPRYLPAQPATTLSSTKKRYREEYCKEERENKRPRLVFPLP